jgi:uncharacterized SAM-binding protein YcdF (DUF218 family)
MFFGAAKLLGIFETPGEVLLLLLLAGLGVALSQRFGRTGLRIAMAVAFMFLAIAVLPTGAWVSAPLENRFPQTALPVHVDGLIVLGGAVDPMTTVRRHIPSLNSHAERMTEFVHLAKLYPAARLVFSGGGAVFSPDPRASEAMVAREFFSQQGLDVRRVAFESRSRDTYENVLFTKAIVRPRPGQVWLLVQSAADVPRSMGIFRKLGWPVIPVPVGYKSDGANSIDFANHLAQLDGAVHEWLGLLVYRLTGRTDALFPAPQNS